MKLSLKWIRATLLSAAALLACSGCVTSDQPLSAIKDAKPDTRLAGQWHADPGKPGAADENFQDFRISFDEHDQGCVAFQNADGSWQPSSGHPNFFVTRTATACYLNLYDDGSEKQPGQPSDQGKFSFFRYRVSDDQKSLTYWMLNSPFFEQAVTEGRIKGKMAGQKTGQPGDVRLLDSSTAILQFIESSPTTDVYSAPVVATRIP